MYPGVEIRRGVTSSTRSRNLRQLPRSAPVRSCHGRDDPCGCCMGPCRAPNSVTEVVYVSFRHRRRTRTETNDRDRRTRRRRSRRGGGAEADVTRTELFGDATPTAQHPAPLRYALRAPARGFHKPRVDESRIHALSTDLTHSRPSLVIYLTKPSRVCCPPSPRRSADTPLWQDTPPRARRAPSHTRVRHPAARRGRGRARVPRGA